MREIILQSILCLLYLTINLNSQAQSLKSDSLDILEYTIHLNEINFSAHTINACTEIKVTPKQNNITAIPLDLLQFQINNIWVNGNNIANYSYNDTLLIIPLLNPINTIDTITLKIYYSGTPQIESYGWGGFHFNHNYAYNLGVAFAANPHNYGRTWFPCFDEFKDRATFNIFATIPENKVVVCGGEKINEINNGDGTKTVNWHLSTPIPTYLASIAIDDYVHITQEYQGIEDTFPLDLYVRENEQEAAEASFENLPQIVEAFEYYFGAYPWNRVGFVSTALGSMEHASNIAFTRNAINGNLTYEWLIAHELSHMWFGDKVTCASAEDMWLNEGWAVFCESLYKEYVYGKEAYNQYQRKKQIKVIRDCHNLDGDFYPVYGIPHNLTYGATVYQKGGCIVHTMRSYMGDSLFFSTVKAYLNEFAYNYANSENMKIFFSEYSGIDMTDFFENWIYTEGFPHFSIDSFDVEQKEKNYSIDVYVRQKLYHAPTFYNSNRVPITFMNNNWEQYIDTLYFSGKTGMNTFEIPFCPEFIMLDFENAMIDAITDEAKIIKTTGEYHFTNAYFKINVQQNTDSVLIFAQHNWVAPDTMKQYTEGLVFSNNRYYKIEGTFTNNFVAQGKFFYNFNLFDQGIATSEIDSLRLLYRKDASQDWIEKEYTIEGGSSFGYLVTENIKPGEYTIALWQPNESTKKTILNKCNDKFINVFPNPSDNSFNITFNNKQNCNTQPYSLKIYNQTGVLIKEIQIKNQNTIKWKPTSKKNGFYYVNLLSNSKILQTEKIIYKK